MCAKQKLPRESNALFSMDNWIINLDDWYEQIWDNISHSTKQDKLAEYSACKAYILQLFYSPNNTCESWYQLLPGLGLPHSLVNLLNAQ